MCGVIHPEGDACGALADGRIGTIVDKYRIVGLLGRGGMGSVYEAQHVTLHRRFAVKFMLPEYAANRSTLRRFENEARAAGGLEHANIAAVTDIGQAPDGSPYLVMEYLSGQDGAKLLARLGPLPVQRTANIVFQACLGLAVAHKAGIVHRDIKPENLFIADAGDGNDLVKILDFGIAKLRSPDASVATASGMMIGTFFYMSPEQVRDAAKVDPRTDVWALGVVLYELLTGKKPFDGAEPTEILYQIVHECPQSPDEHRAGLASDLITIIDQALQKDIERRLPSVTAFAEALAPFTGRPFAQPQEPSAIGAVAPQAVPVTVPVRPTTADAAASAISKISASPFAKAPKWRLSILIAGTLFAVIIGVFALATLRVDRRSRHVPASSLATDRPANGPSASAVLAVPTPSAPAGLAPPSAVLPSTSVSGDSTSNNVRTLPEQAHRGSDRVPLNGRGRSTSRPTASQTPEKASKIGVAPAQPQAKSSAPTNPRLSIDPDIPF